MAENNKPTIFRTRHVYWVAGAGLGATLGWFLAPSGEQKIGLGIGVALGALLVSVWAWYRRRSSAQKTAAPHFGWGGKTVYLIFISLALLFAIYALRIWILQPEKWLEALAGLLFSLVGIMVFILLWRRDALAGSNEYVEMPGTMALGFCCFAVAALSLLLVVLGNPVVGILGAVFFGWCGILLIRKSISSKQPR